MNTADLHQLENYVDSIAARIKLILSDCRDSDRVRICDPAAQSRALDLQLSDLYAWLSARKTGKKP